MWKAAFLSIVTLLQGLGQGHGMDCNDTRLDQISVMDDFTLSQFVGTWYEVKWYSEVPDTPEHGSDIKEIFEKAKDNSYKRITITRVLNQTSDLVCDHQLRNVTVNSTAKLDIIEEDDYGSVTATPYWVIFTDYSSVALVYSCRNATNETCYETHVQVLSRESELNTTNEDVIDEKIKTALCLNNQEFNKTKHKEECRDCRVSGFKGQEDFNMIKFLGKWSQEKWLPPNYTDPDDYLRDFWMEIDREGETEIFNVLDSGRTKNDTCRNSVGKFFLTQNVGILEYERDWNSTTLFRTSYMVASTDYDNYAVVYVCREEDEAGVCDLSAVEGYVFSRYGMLMADAEEKIEEAITEVCLDEKKFLKTEQKKECPDCRVSIFKPMQDFNITEYLGQWYLLKWVPPPTLDPNDFYDDIWHNYEANDKLGSDNKTSKIIYSGRSNETGCEQGVGKLIQTSTPGVLEYEFTWNGTVIKYPYWVVGTDYNNYAVAYGCVEQDKNGFCLPSAVRSWVFSRTVFLTGDAKESTDELLDVLCIDKTKLVEVTHEEECFDCRISKIPTQRDFNADEFDGMWFEVKRLHPEDDDPYANHTDYWAEYNLMDDQMTYDVTYAGRENGTCYRKIGKLNRPTNTSKMEFERSYNSTTTLTTPFWVVYTDYRMAALVYGCREESDIGTCAEGQADVWVFSRQQEMNKNEEKEINEWMNTLCVDTSRLVNTTQENECEDCRVSEMYVVRDFDVNEFDGKWYELSLIPHEHHQQDQYPTDLWYEYAETKDNKTLNITSSGREATQNDTCFYKRGTLHMTEEPGKFEYEMKWNDSVTFKTPFWVVDTDYNNYALIYGCRKVHDGGDCYDDAESSWVLSRSPMELNSEANRTVHDRLRGLCLDDSQFVSTSQDNDCRDCTVSKFFTQQDFNIDEFDGKWFEVSRYKHSSGENYTDHWHQYELSSDNKTLEVGAAGRMEDDNTTCFRKGGKLHLTDDPGKFMYEREVNGEKITTPFWVVYTDYMGVALIYGCRKEKEDGTCPKTETDAWVLSRMMMLSENEEEEVNERLQALCLGEDDFVPTAQDNECKDCRISKFPTMANFELSEFIGRWNEVKRLPNSLTDINGNYSDKWQNFEEDKENNDTIIAPLALRLASDNTTCFNRIDKIYTTSEAAKMEYERKVNSSVTIRGDFWVVDTDYNSYCLVYGCREKASDGTCVAGKADAWIFSRMMELTEDNDEDMEDLIGMLCLDPKDFVRTEQKENCKDCDVDDIPVQQDFVLDRYQGQWYELKRLRHENEDHLMDYWHDYKKSSDNDTWTVGYSGKSEDKCQQGLATLYLTSEAGKMEFERKVNSTTTVRSQYQVVYTDYNIAVVYGCREKGESGSCVAGGVDLWVLSRMTELTEDDEETVEELLEGLCLDMKDLVNTTQTKPCKDCNIDNFRSMQDFDMERFADRWYEVMWLPTNYTTESDYLDDPWIDFEKESDNVTYKIIKAGRPKDDNSTCTMEFGKLTNSSSATMMHEWKVNSTTTLNIPFWVIDTDYMGYAIVYGCIKPDEANYCPAGLNVARVFTRFSPMSDDDQETVDEIIEELCMEKSDFVKPTHGQECRDCRTSRFMAMEDFDPAMFDGRWYEIKWLPFNYTKAEDYLQDYWQEYEDGEDGVMNVIYSGRRDNKCEYYQGKLHKTSVPAKMELERDFNDTTTIRTPFWVIDTDYSNYAFVYGCREADESGTCKESEIDAWIMSRFKTLDDQYYEQFSELIKDYCLDIDKFVATDQEKECADCRFAQFRGLEEFDKNEFLGTWFKYKYIARKDVDPYTDYAWLEFKEGADPSDHMKVKYGGRVKNPNLCEYEDDYVYFTETPGRLEYERQVNTSTVREPFWVMYIDYQKVAFVFGCRETDKESNHCLPDFEDAWILTREKELGEEEKKIVDDFIYELCLDDRKFVTPKRDGKC